MDVCGGHTLEYIHAITYPHDTSLSNLLLFGMKNDYQQCSSLTTTGAGNSFLLSFKLKGGKDVVPGYKWQVHYAGFTL